MDTPPSMMAGEFIVELILVTGLWLTVWLGGIGIAITVALHGVASAIRDQRVIPDSGGTDDC